MIWTSASWRSWEVKSQRPQPTVNLSSESELKCDHMCECECVSLSVSVCAVQRACKLAGWAVEGKRQMFGAKKKKWESGAIRKGQKSNRKGAAGVAPWGCLDRSTAPWQHSHFGSLVVVAGHLPTLSSFPWVLFRTEMTQEQTSAGLSYCWNCRNNFPQIIPHFLPSTSDIQDQYFNHHTPFLACPVSQVIQRGTYPSQSRLKKWRKEKREGGRKEVRKTKNSNPFFS